METKNKFDQDQRRAWIYSKQLEYVQSWIYVMFTECNQWKKWPCVGGIIIGFIHSLGKAFYCFSVCVFFFFCMCVCVFFFSFFSFLYSFFTCKSVKLFWGNELVSNPSGANVPVLWLSSLTSGFVIFTGLSYICFSTSIRMSLRWSTMAHCIMTMTLMALTHRLLAVKPSSETRIMTPIWPSDMKIIHSK